MNGVLFGLAVSTLLSANPAVAVLAVGKCDDLSLQGFRDQLSSDLAARAPQWRVIDAQTIGRQLGRDTLVPLHDVKARFTAANQAYLSGLQLEALQEIKITLEQIDNIAPGADRWALKRSSELLLGLVLREEGQQPEMKEAFRRVLRLQPDHQLSADYFAPTVREDFERVRTEVRSAKKAWLAVHSSPAGAQVFADGLELGRTPFSRELLPGHYRIQVVADGVVSRTRAVNLRDERRVAVDLAVDRKIHAARPICMAEMPPQAVASAAMQYAQLVGANEIMVVVGGSQPTVIRVDAAGSKASSPQPVTLSTADVSRATELLLRANPILPIEAPPPVSRRTCKPRTMHEFVLELAMSPIRAVVKPGPGVGDRKECEEQ